MKVKKYKIRQFKNRILDLLMYPLLIIDYFINFLIFLLLVALLLFSFVLIIPNAFIIKLLVHYFILLEYSEMLLIINFILPIILQIFNFSIIFIDFTIYFPTFLLN